MKNQKLPLGKKKYLLLGALLLLGLALLFYGGSGRDKNEAVEPSESLDAEVYRRELTEEIAALCGQVKGVGRATVLVSLSGGYEYVYARDADGDCLSVGSGSGKQAVVESILPPVISGIGIVCEGGGDAAVRAELTALLTAALGVGANKIYITS